MTDTDRIVDIMASGITPHAWTVKAIENGDEHQRRVREDNRKQIRRALSALAAAGLPVQRLADVMDGKAVIVMRQNVLDAAEVVGSVNAPGNQRLARALRAAAKEDQTND